jgi:hypothetical protein
MSDFVEWIGAQAGERDPAENAIGMHVPGEAGEKQSPQDSFPGDDSWVELRGHNFPGQPVFNEALFEDPLDRNPDLWLYRKRTVGLLRRYVRFSLETGRLPSLVGREFFRARMTAYTASTFEDRVIFVRDVEKCLNRLEYWDQQMIARIIMQEHSHERAACILHCSRSTVARRLPQVLDLLSEDFLRVGLLTVLPPKREPSR